MNATEMQCAAERGFGGLWDALGLKPVRQMQQAALALAGAQADELAAQGQYARVTASAWVEGLRRMASRVDDLRSGGEPVASPTALLRLWIGELDEAMHAAMLSEPGLDATAATVRAAARRRIALQRIVALASESLEMPTNADVDAAFREIQQLKREVRRLKRAAHDTETGSVG